MHEIATIKTDKIFAALPKVERGVPVRLSGDPKGQNFLYCHGNSVYIRNIDDPLQVDIYTQHSRQTTVARYSPSRFYIASSDITGKVRIWDTVNAEHILKAEYPTLSRGVFDLDWSPDSKRICVGGNGERFAHVFTMDTGTSLGDADLHCKKVNTVVFRQARPFKIVTASEDMQVHLYGGPPFVFKSKHTGHSNFVNVARYTPNSELVVSGGADGKLIKYDGITLAPLEWHKDMENKDKKKGGIYEVAFSSDSTKMLVAFGDRNCRLYDVGSGELLIVFTFNEFGDWRDMQIGALWQGEHMISVNGCGYITYLDPENPAVPKRVIKGHVLPITSLAISSDRAYCFTGGQEGVMCWNIDSGECDSFSGTGHSAQLTDMAVCGNTLVSIGMDDVVRFASTLECRFSDISLNLESQPRRLAVQDDVVVVASLHHLTVLDAQSKRFSMPINYEATSVSIHPNCSTVAVGSKNRAVLIYSLDGTKKCGAGLSEKTTVVLSKEVTTLSYSPDGSHLLVAAERTVFVYSTHDYKELKIFDLHSARVLDVAWSPDGASFASVGVDGFLYVGCQCFGVKPSYPGIKAHTMSNANRVTWLNDNTMVTAGQDSNVKLFTIDN